MPPPGWGADDLSGRRGEILNREDRDGGHVITALVPLANLFDYARALNAMTQGRGGYVTQFDRYEPVPLPRDDPPGPLAPAAALRA